jgi:hypothetical protein
MGPLLWLTVAGIVLIGALVMGVVILIKLGVIAKYAAKKEPPDRGIYDLDQSHESGEK